MEAHTHRRLVFRAGRWLCSGARGKAALGRTVERHGQCFFAHTWLWGCGAAAGTRDVCRIHSTHTRLLAGNPMVHSRCGWCNSVTPHRGLGINYTLESHVCVCAAVGPGQTPSLSHTPCARAAAAGGAEPRPSTCNLEVSLTGQCWCRGVCGRVGLLPTGRVL